MPKLRIWNCSRPPTLIFALIGHNRTDGKEEVSNWSAIVARDGGVADLENASEIALHCGFRQSEVRKRREGLRRRPDIQRSARTRLLWTGPKNGQRSTNQRGKKNPGIEFVARSWVNIGSEGESLNGSSSSLNYAAVEATWK